MNRTSGVLMHISSLPGDYGIGDFGKGAYKFVDFLYNSKQKNWQILPLSITGYGDSPYQSFSAFAGNPYFIDIEKFINNRVISKEYIESLDLGKDKEKINYNKLYNNKYKLLRKIFENLYSDIHKELNDFYSKEESWLKPFALFMSLKTKYKGQSLSKWDNKYKKYDSKEVLEFEKNNKKELYFWIFTQYYFLKQWKNLKKYANNKNIKIIGDMPIYVSEDSADVWANPKLFDLDKNLKPKTVSGVPTDGLADKGQLWGNPIYNWEKMKELNYNWWVKRIKYSFELYDKLRIDHFRGFEAYWEIEQGVKDARVGKWVKGPGIDLFREIKENLGELDIIAEDLGYITKEVKDLLAETGYPGMKILQFAFEGDSSNEHLPHNYNKNSVAFTGTHDSKTLVGWFKSISDEELNYAVDYFNLTKKEGYNWGTIRGLWSSVASTAIIPLQDFLGLGEEARINVPSTLSGNWTWRVDEKKLTDNLSKKIAHITNLYGR